MPMQTLISLISDQAIPNLLFIKVFSVMVDKFVFITTPFMQSLSKTRHLIDAAGLEPRLCREVVVDDENNLDSMQQILKNELPGSGYIVNITCGTKMMFLAAYNVFREPGNKVFYLPIGKNTINELYPGNSVFEATYRLNVREYLAAYGITFSALMLENIQDYSFLKQILNEYRRLGYDINALQNTQKDSSKYFFTGGWFEHYAYHLIRQKLNHAHGFIETGLKINNFQEQHRAGNDNELDVVFTLNNELHVIEAKVSLGINKVKRVNIEKAMFKMSALNKNFGLRSYSWLYTLSDLSSEPPDFIADLNRKMKVLGIRGIVDRNMILNKLIQIL
jgi:hypothetical protein